MKSNNLSKKINECNCNFVKGAKYYLSVIGALIISAVIILSVIGFKLGFDFKGGSIVEVVYGVTFDDAGNQYENGSPYNEQLAKGKIEEVLSTFGEFEVSSIQTAESEYGNKVVYKLLNSKSLTNEDYANLENELYKAFDEYKQNGLIQSNYISAYGVSGTETNVAVYGAIGLSVAIVMLAILALIRYGLSAGLTMLIVSVINSLLMFATVLITRITVNSAFVASVLTVFVVSLIMNMIYFDKVRDNNKKDLTREEVANNSVKQSLIPNLLTFAVALIALVLVTGLGTLPIREFGAPAMVGTFFAIASATFALPFFYNYINVEFKKKRRK